MKVWALFLGGDEFIPRLQSYQIAVITTAFVRCRQFNPNGDSDIILVDSDVADSDPVYALGQVLSFHSNV